MSQPARSMWEGDPSDEEREKVLRSLARGYFTPTGRSVLDPFLFAAGFRLRRSSADELVYRRGRCILKFGYAPYVSDDQPRYALSAAIGLDRGWLRKPRIIGLWQVPCPDRGGNRWGWQFRGPDQLKSSLKKLIPLLDEYARPLWEDESRLRSVIDKEWPIYLELANP